MLHSIHRDALADTLLNSLTAKRRMRAELTFTALDSQLQVEEPLARDELSRELSVVSAA